MSQLKSRPHRATSPTPGLLATSSSSRGFSCTNQSCFLWIFCDLPTPRPAQTLEVFRKKEKRKEENFLPEPPLAWLQPHPPSDHMSAALRGLAGLWDPSQLLVKSHGQLTHTSLCSLGLPLIRDVLIPACFLCSVIQGLCLRGSLGLYLSVCLSLPPLALLLSPLLSLPLSPAPPPLLLPSSLPVSLPVHPPHFPFVFLHIPPALSLAPTLRTPLSSWHPHTQRALWGPCLPCLSLSAWVVGAFLRWAPGVVAFLVAGRTAGCLTLL